MKEKNLLIDTDIGPDCDDVGALALLNIYANKGLCNILGIGHCTSNPYGAGAIDAICQYYGRPAVEIGTYKGQNFLSDEKCMIYNRSLVMNMKNRYKNQQPEDACRMYRRILAAQPDKSVEFIAIGPLNNLSALLDSKPDSLSALTGKELISQKINRLVLMAGIFQPDGKGLTALAEEITGCPISKTEEFNVKNDVPAAQNVASNWPTPKEYLGFEAGLLETGVTEKSTMPSDHPVRMAYEMYTKTGLRYSWDLLAVEFAVVDGCSHFKRSELGTVKFDECGRTIWTASTHGRDCYVKWAQTPDTIAKDINQVLDTPLD